MSRYSGKSQLTSTASRTDIPPKTLNIRTANSQDSEGIKAVVFTVLEEYGLPPDPGETDRDLEAIDEQYNDNGGYFGVIEDNGTIVATIGIYRVNEHTCELRKMYALPNQRGKGLGTSLMQFAIQTARDLGFKRMILETATPLQEAIALYRKFGFKEYEPEHMVARCDQAFERGI